jgi:ABC-type multidrug transport system fused ATPase/permease subunit
VEMSGGQNQKVAIARALYKNASLIILDEPTSALDPLAEAEIYEHFNSLVGEKTALYISHRMSSSVFCDRVLVLEDGIVRDFDTHQNLMKKPDSLYYKLFEAQAENYRVERAAF